MARLSLPQALVLAGVVALIAYQAGLLADPIETTMWLAGIVVGITVHEFNHAFVAVSLGDPTPKKMGRVSLNPLRHLDLLGTLMLIVAHFGWGRPVIFNPANLRINPGVGSALVSVAGPAANLIAAFALAYLVKLSVGGFNDALIVVSTETGVEALALMFLITVVRINVLLAVFNLLPVPPLDGFGVVSGLVPGGERLFAPLYNYGPLILVGLLFLPSLGGPNLLAEMLLPLGRSLERLVWS